MKVSTDALISALLDQRLKLVGDAEGGVSLYCSACKGHPVAYYGRTEGDYKQPGVTYVTAIPSLWAEAAKHLEASHQAGDRS